MPELKGQGGQQPVNWNMSDWYKGNNRKLATETFNRAQQRGVNFETKQGLQSQINYWKQQVSNFAKEGNIQKANQANNNLKSYQNRLKDIQIQEARQGGLTDVRKNGTINPQGSTTAPPRSPSPTTTLPNSQTKAPSPKAFSPPPPIVPPSNFGQWVRSGGNVLKDIGQTGLKTLGSPIGRVSPLIKAPVLTGGFLAGYEIGSDIYEDASNPNSWIRKTFDAIQGIKDPWSNIKNPQPKVTSRQSEISPKITQPEVPATFQGGQVIGAIYRFVGVCEQDEGNWILTSFVFDVEIAGPITSLPSFIYPPGGEWATWQWIHPVTGVQSEAPTFGRQNPNDPRYGIGSLWGMPRRNRNPRITGIVRMDGTSLQNDIIQGGNPPPQQPEQVIQPQTLEPPRIEIELDYSSSNATTNVAPPSPTPTPTTKTRNPTPTQIPIAPSTQADTPTEETTETPTAPSLQPIPKPDFRESEIFTPNFGLGNEPKPKPKTPELPKNTPNPTPAPTSDPTKTPNSTTQPVPTETGGQTTTTKEPSIPIPFTPPIKIQTPETTPKTDPNKTGHTPTESGGDCCLPLGLGQKQIQEKQNTTLDKLDALGQVIDLSLLTKIDATTLRTEGKVNTLDNKLGDQIPNGGIGGFITRAFRATRIDKALNAINTILILHNALMLSQGIGRTLGIALSQGLSAMGIKDENGDPLDINQAIGNSITEFLKSLVGESLWNSVNEEFKKANAIYTASVNVLDNVTNMMDTLANGMELIGKYNAKIGNALKAGGQVFENAYDWMDDNINIHFGRLGKLQSVINGLNEVGDIASDFEEITSNVVEFQDTIIELGESKKEFNDTLKENEETKKEEQDQAKLASKSPIINQSDLIKSNEN